jgi:hypothetical protein
VALFCIQISHEKCFENVAFRHKIVMPGAYFTLKALVRRAIFASNITIKRYCDKTIFFFNSWLFKLILKSKSNILSKKYCFINIALSFYRNIACENRPSDEGLRDFSEVIWYIGTY